MNDVTGDKVSFYDELQWSSKFGDTGYTGDDDGGTAITVPTDADLDIEFVEDAWVTFTLDTPVDLSDAEYSNIIIEIAEHDSIPSCTDEDCEPASLYYQHVYTKRAIRWSSTFIGSKSYPYEELIPTSLPYANLTYDQKVPMIQFCVYPDECPQRTRLSAQTSGFRVDDVDDGTYPLDATVSVALNGQNFIQSDSKFHLYDDTYMYFKPAALAPVLGVTSGFDEMQITMYIPGAFPMYDLEGYVDFQEERTETIPVDNVVVRFDSTDPASDFMEFAVGKFADEATLQVDDDSGNAYLYVISPPLQEGTYVVSVSINGADFWPYDSANSTDEDTSHFFDNILLFSRHHFDLHVL